MYVLFQVQVLHLGLCASTAEVNAQFTYYPNMPGNSTRHPDEKMELQKHIMASPYAYSNSQIYLCQLMTLSAVMDANNFAEVDLLKVMADFIYKRPCSHLLSVHI